jgi:hypothetical protein
MILDESLARKFLAENKIQNCEIKKIAGDASFRSYYRIKAGNDLYVLMYAPPTHEEIKHFITVDEFLVSHDFSAPKIFARDYENGFLLLEDLGDETYGRILAKEKDSKKLESELYHHAIDCLLALHKIKEFPSVPNYNHAELFREVMLFVDWYLPLHEKKISLQQKADFKFLWFAVFDLLSKKSENISVVLRDYHADNLMILPKRKSFKQVGLLDFQDALIGSKAYDLVSLLEDARRDVDLENSKKLFDYYLKKSSCDKDEFIRDYSILSLQRNIKILGIFCRLSRRDGKHEYIKLLPRVSGFVKNRIAMKEKELFEIGKFLKNFL